MDAITIILIAIGLAMDCFAVSVAGGVTIKTLKSLHALRIAVFFGFFQGFMALMGWLAASNFSELVAEIDHWIAFILLAIIGGRMVWDSFRDESERKPIDPTNLKVLLILSVATSIDALAIGVSFAFLETSVVVPILTIGLASFLFSIAGVYIGDKVGGVFEKRAELLGGIILIAIGLKILTEHLFF
jgi:putative Mn2+ efflux pump MntP